MNRCHTHSDRSFAFHMVLAFAVGACSIAITTAIATAGPIPTSDSFTMADAIAPGAFYVTESGRFQFDEFTYNAVPPGGETPRAEDVWVTVTETDDMVMLRFQIVGLTNIVMAGDAWDMQLGYRASALGELDVFSGHTLALNSATMGDASVALNEVIYAGNGDLLTTTPHFVYDNIGNTGDRKLLDTVTFEPTRSIVVTDKDLAVSGGAEDGNGTAFVSHFKQTFHVQPIPEPSGMALLLLGCAGLGMVGWYSRRIG